MLFGGLNPVEQTFVMGVEVVPDEVSESLQLSFQVAALVLASLLKPLLELVSGVVAVSTQNPVCSFLLIRDEGFDF